MRDANELPVSTNLIPVNYPWLTSLVNTLEKSSFQRRTRNISNREINDIGSLYICSAEEVI